MPHRRQKHSRPRAVRQAAGPSFRHRRLAVLSHTRSQSFPRAFLRSHVSAFASRRLANGGAGPTVVTTSPVSFYGFSSVAGGGPIRKESQQKVGDSILFC